MASDETLCKIFKRLSKDPDPLIRGAVASNENLPKSCACEILLELGKDCAEFEDDDGYEVYWTSVCRQARSTAIALEGKAMSTSCVNRILGFSVC